MSDQKKMVEEITSMEVDFAKWYTDVVKKAELVDYASTRGCMIIRPYGYAIWENIQKDLDSADQKMFRCRPLKYPEFYRSNEPLRYNRIVLVL